MKVGNWKTHHDRTGALAARQKQRLLWAENLLVETSTRNILTWTPKVCRIIAFYRFWAIVLPTLRGLGKPEKTLSGS